MKIMWIVNIIFPYPAKQLGLSKSVFGGWLSGLFENLLKSKKIDNFVVATTYNGNKLLNFNDGNVNYYLVPCKNNIKYYKSQEKYWKEIYDLEKPNVVHIHGTEFPHSLCFLKACGGEKVCISIQGLVSMISKKEIYYAGVDKFPITFRDIIRFDNVYQQRKKYEKRGFFENESLRLSNTVIGRTKWDKEYAYSINSKVNYVSCNESLRGIFYEKEWNIKNIERHSIFVSQASYPIKGFHKLLEAAVVLKEKYLDLKIYVAGMPIIKKSTLKDKIKLSGYGKLLNDLIKKYNLVDTVIFTGLLSEEKMCDRLLKSNVFVQCSSIENSPNSLGEAMLVGMPCVASNVGGTSDMLLDKKEGFLYSFGDLENLVKYIENIFSDDKLAVKIGCEARKHALVTHNVKSNVDQMLKIYEGICK